MSNGLPYSGAAVQKFIKDKFNTKAGIFYNDTTNNRYLVFADEETRDSYLQDTSQTNLIIGTFDAPFNYTAEIELISNPYQAISLGSTGNYIEFDFDIKNKNGISTGDNITCTFTITKGSLKKIVTQKYRAGVRAKFNVDEYLSEGTNRITIGIIGQQTLAATTIGVTY